MIIAAYAGTGKSTFAARFSNAADVVSMPRSWILPPIAPEGETELEKGKLDRLRDPLYPENYIIDILRAEQEYDYVLIPTTMQVIPKLREEYGRKVVLCYPADELKEEYRERFAARGNGEDFLDLFIGTWDSFLEPVREYQDAVHIVMGSGVYLTDLKERLDSELLSDDMKPVPEETIAALERELQDQRHNFALRIGWDFWYRISDVLDPDERTFLAELARRACEDGVYPPCMIAPRSYAEKRLPAESLITDDRVRAIEYLEQYQEEVWEKFDEWRGNND